VKAEFRYFVAGNAQSEHMLEELCVCKTVEWILIRFGIGGSALKIVNVISVCIGQIPALCEARIKLDYFSEKLLII
jgi:hypothetical protein